MGANYSEIVGKLAKGLSQLLPEISADIQKTAKQTLLREEVLSMFRKAFERNRDLAGYMSITFYE